jgi:hypothetical protein
MYKSFISLVLALFVANSAMSQGMPHKFFVFELKTTNKQFIVMSYKQDPDEPNRVFVRMAEENDEQFSNEIKILKSCFTRALGAINDPMSALISLAKSESPTTGTAIGDIRARNSRGGMVRKTLACDAPNFGPVGIF